MAFATIDVTKGITGTIPVANGGTGIASGTTGQFLKFTGTTTIASAADNGKILQVVSSNNTYGMTTSSTSYIDVESSSGTTWEVAITPSATTSKILLMSTLSLTIAANAQAEGRGSMEIYEKVGSGSYSQMIDNNEAIGFYDYGSHGSWTSKTVSNSILRTKNTTSAVSYKFIFRVHNGATSCYFNQDNRQSNCVLMEIAG